MLHHRVESVTQHSFETEPSFFFIGLACFACIVLSASGCTTKYSGAQFSGKAINVMPGWQPKDILIFKKDACICHINQHHYFYGEDSRHGYCLIIELSKIPEFKESHDVNDSIFTRAWIYRYSLDVMAEENPYVQFFKYTSEQKRQNPSIVALNGSANYLVDKNGLISIELDMTSALGDNDSQEVILDGRAYKWKEEISTIEAIVGTIHIISDGVPN